MSDKRRASRRDTFYYLTVSDAATGVPYGRIVDISPKGLLLVTENARAMADTVDAVVQIPPGSGAGSNFRCRLTRRWQRRDRNPSLTLLGCEMQIDPEALTTVDNLILRYSFGGEIRPPSDGA